MLDITESMDLIQEQPDPVMALLLGSMAAGGLASVSAGDNIVKTTSTGGNAYSDLQAGKGNISGALTKDEWFNIMNQHMEGSTLPYDLSDKYYKQVLPRLEAKGLYGEAAPGWGFDAPMEEGERKATPKTFIDPKTKKPIQRIDTSSKIFDPNKVFYDEDFGYYTTADNIQGTESNIFEQILTNPASYLGAAGLIAGPTVALGIRGANAARIVDSLS